MKEEKSSWRQKIRKFLVVVGIVAACVLVFGLIVAVIGGYHSNWEWTGFNSGTNQIPITSNSKVIYTATIPQPSKTLWDWLQLLFVPAILTLGAIWFTARQNHDREIAEARAEIDMEIADRRYQADYQLALNNQQETALQTYIDKMSELLLKEHLGERTVDGKLKPEQEEVRKIARLRTITVLTQLDVRRVGYIFTFLRDAELMSTISNDNVVSLSNSDLHDVGWDYAQLDQANLSGANLKGASLSNANLRRANLDDANLSQVDLNGADLSFASLSQADLNGADLRGAMFRDANLNDAILFNAKLSQAILEEVNLNKAWVTREQLAEAASLKGATMPDGSKHP